MDKINYKEIEATLIIKLKATLDDNKDNTQETVRYLVEQDLLDNGYDVESVEIVKE